jgi:hypothetical protein
LRKRVGVFRRQVADGEGCKLTISPLKKRLDGRFSDSKSDILEHTSPDIFSDDGVLDEPPAASRN